MKSLFFLFFANQIWFSEFWFLPLMMKYRTAWQHKQQQFYAHMDHHRVNIYVTVHTNTRLSYQHGCSPLFVQPTHESTDSSLHNPINEMRGMKRTVTTVHLFIRNETDNEQWNRGTFQSDSMNHPFHRHLCTKHDKMTFNPDIEYSDFNSSTEHRTQNVTVSTWSVS